MRALWLLPPLAVGALLRLWGLSRQILFGDEVHAVVAALGLTVPEILTTYRIADHCIPLSALYRLLMDGGVRISEGVLRTPVAIAGLAALVLFPVGAARWRELGGGWRRAAVLAWLVAVSPGLIYYSRFARPYAMVVVLAPVAAAAFWHWWRGGGHRWAALYLLAGAVSAWFFLGSAPFVAAPLAWAAGDLAWRRLGRRPENRGRGLLALGAAGTGLAAGIAAFLLPALPSFLRLVRRKASFAWADAGDLAAVAQVLAGTSWPLLAVLFWALAGVGLAAFLRRRPALASYTLVLVVGHWAALLLVLRPEGIGVPFVINRYVLVTLPVILLWVAEGVVWLGELLGRGVGMAEKAVVAACVAALVAGGPFAADPASRLGSFAGTTPMLTLYREPPALPPSAVPAAYRQIAAEPGDEAVIEPAFAKGAIYSLRPTIYLAALHRRPVILAAGDPWRSDLRLAFRTVVPADPGAMERSGGRFVVLHLDLPSLYRVERAVERGGRMPRPTPGDHPANARARELARTLEREWGEPHLVSGDVLLWDLARVPRGPSPR